VQVDIMPTERFLEAILFEGNVELKTFYMKTLCSWTSGFSGATLALYLAGLNK
jgi:hypothetical protein